MKGSKEFKRFVAKNRALCKAAHWDLLFLLKEEHGKGWFKRQKRLTKEEKKELYESDDRNPSR